MSLFLAIITALAYTIGGIFMKLSQGLTVPIPTVAVYALFLLGVTLQILLTNGSGLGITYILVLGLEAVMATLFGMYIFGEKLSPLNLSGIVLVLIGVIFLRSHNN
jgi:small multidrug resistance pump/quaternary ammonium compound-resistance protein SugE